jgi:hypothetical protein
MEAEPIAKRVGHSPNGEFRLASFSADARHQRAARRFHGRERTTRHVRCRFAKQKRAM